MFICLFQVINYKTNSRRRTTILRVFVCFIMFVCLFVCLDVVSRAERITQDTKTNTKTLFFVTSARARACVKLACPWRIYYAPKDIKADKFAPFRASTIIINCKINCLSCLILDWNLYTRVGLSSLIHKLISLRLEQRAERANCSLIHYGKSLLCCDTSTNRLN